MKNTKSETSKKKAVRVTATLLPGHYDSLENIAAKNNVSVAWLIRRAVDRFIEDVEGGLKLPFGN